MATEYTLKRTDGKPLGSFDEIQALIRGAFPTVQFAWTTSGQEKLRIAKERGIELPSFIRQSLETLPALLEGVVSGKDFHVTFGLGHEEPVTCLYVTPRGESVELERGLDALKAAMEAEFKVSGEG